MISPADLGKKVLQGLRESDQPPNLKELWDQDRATEWTNWMVGHKHADDPAILKGIAKALGYETVEYEWFRTDQYWYDGMAKNDWDWDDWADKGSVAVEHENRTKASYILYDIRKLCNIAVPFKLFIGYSKEPSGLLRTIQELVEKRERVRTASYVVIFGWWRNDQLEWRGWLGTFKDKKFESAPV